MKKLVFVILVTLKSLLIFAQTGDSATQQAGDTLIKTRTLALGQRTGRTVDTIKKSTVPRVLRTPDSLARLDTSRLAIDTLAPAKADSPLVATAHTNAKKPIDSIYLRLLNNPFFNTSGKPLYLVVNERTRQYKDEAFYLVAGLLLFLAFIKLIFSRYFKNMFLLFFQPSFRQKQTREQLQQNNLPSLLLNLFFVFSSGAYIAFLLTYYRLTGFGFWLIFFYSTASLLALYLGKYIFLSFAGWVFNVKEAAGSYIFSVYLINKMIGVLLIPFILVIAFSQPDIINVSITVCLLVVVLLFLYRYFVSYAPVRREVKVDITHFFFYIAAFEIVPLLLIYKTLIIYLSKSL